jgi:hypothetical protein
MKTIKFLSSVALVVILSSISIQAEPEKTYVVDPGAYMYVEWNFGEATTVSAKFRARGGSGNDIEVFIVDEEGFENWRNGHNAPTFYNSGRVTVGHFNLRLKPGKYFRVMNNRFSAVSNKVVTFTFY